jgi:hypothetical protein
LKTREFLPRESGLRDAQVVLAEFKGSLSADRRVPASPVMNDGWSREFSLIMTLTMRKLVATIYCHEKPIL